MKKENEKLKKELSCFKSKESFTLPTNYIKNKFMSFIVILGIVFLLSLFKDVWR